MTTHRYPLQPNPNPSGRSINSSRNLLWVVLVNLALLTATMGLMVIQVAPTTLSQNLQPPISVARGLSLD
jgi:hypothetical protein